MLSKDSTPNKQLEVKLTVENTIKLDPQNPIPIQYGGDSFYVVTGRRYIPFIGKKDNMPIIFLEARLTSTTQNSCITTIAQSVIGKGLTVLDQENPDQDFVNWMKSVNNQQQTFNDILHGVIDGERTHGNQFIEVKRGEFNGKKFLKIYLHPMQYCRLAEPEEGKNDEPTHVLISKLFAKRGVKKVDINKCKKIPLWSDNLLDKKAAWIDNGDGTESTMLHFKNEVAGIDYYGLPASVASLRHQVLEGKSVQYNLDNIDNNMVLGGMLIFKSGMTQQEANQNAKEILMSHVGEGKTGRIAVLSSESGLQDVDWKPYDTQKDGSFKDLDKAVEQKIIASHNWAKEFCNTDGATLGKGSGYLRSLWDLKEAQLLKPLRTKLVEKLVLPIIKIYVDQFDKKELEKYQFSFISAMPFSFMADINPESFMKVKEARELAGLEPDDTVGEKYLSEMKSKSSNVQTKPTTKEGDNND